MPPRPASGRRPTARQRQRGQASLEYGGVLAVVAAVLVLAGAVTGGGAILNGVLRGLERALCRVTGNDCAVTRLSACTVRSRETGGKVGVKLSFVKLGGSFSLLREELSDGTVEVTLVDGVDGAPTAALGASGGVRLGGKRQGGGAIAGAELLVRLGRRQTWRRPDAATADRLVRDIREHVAASIGERTVPILGRGVRRFAHAVGLDGDALPSPDVVGVSAGVEGLVEAGLGDALEGKGAFKASLGGTRDRRSGKRTLVLALEGDASAVVAKAAGGAGLARSAAPTLVVTFASDGTPLELALTEAGMNSGDAGLDLPRRKGKHGGGERVERTSRLDLKRGANRLVYDRLVDALGGGGDLTGAARALVDQLRSSARVDVTRRATAKETYGADAEAAVGGRLGGAVEVSRGTTELLDAWTRPPGGVWEPRTDCVAAGASA